MKKKEQWKTIKGFNNLYLISSYGNLKRKQYSRTFERKGHLVTVTKKEKFITPCLDGEGYYHVRLYQNRYKIKLFKIHRLVAKYFLDDYSENLVVDHINGNKTDNRVSNLRMLTREQNLQAYRKKTKGKNPTYICVETGQTFHQFKRYCDAHDYQYKRFKFRNCIYTGSEYMNYGLHFRVVK